MGPKAESILKGMGAEGQFLTKETRKAFNALAKKLGNMTALSVLATAHRVGFGNPRPGTLLSSPTRIGPLASLVRFYITARRQIQVALRAPHRIKQVLYRHAEQRTLSQQQLESLARQFVAYLQKVMAKKLGDTDA